jgi:predicted RNA-binding Zn-ribbon protein involved in translation (DUF1610 family)
MALNAISYKIVGNQKLPPNIELCNNCEDEVELDTIIQACPKCGKTIIACNMCDYREFGNKCYTCNEACNFKYTEDN